MRSLLVLSVALVGCGVPEVIVTASQSSGRVGLDSVTITATVTPAQQTLVVFQSADGTLSETQVRSNSAGVATTQLTSSRSGSVQVTATVSIGSATSAGLTTVNFTSGTKLRFSTSPSNTRAGDLLRPVPVVVVEQNGATISSSAPITVSVTPGSCTSTLDSTSLTMVNANQGTANFYGLKISTPATGCTLTASSGSFDQGVSAAFDVQ